VDITAEELMKKLQSGESLVLLDVRSEKEFREGHLEGAVLIPLYQLRQRLHEIPKEPGVEIVVYCRSGRRSAAASKILIQAGYRRVRNLQGGILSWQKMGGKLVR